MANAGFRPIILAEYARGYAPVSAYGFVCPSVTMLALGQENVDYILSVIPKWNQKICSNYIRCETETLPWNFINSIDTGPFIHVYTQHFSRAYRPERAAAICSYRRQPINQSIPTVQYSVLVCTTVWLYITHIREKNSFLLLKKSLHIYNKQGRREKMFSGVEAYAGIHGERGARAYNGGLGAEPPAGYRGGVPGQVPLKLIVQKKRHFRSFLRVLGTTVNHYNGGHYFKF